MPTTMEVINAVSTFGTMAATGGLCYLTFVLSQETKAMRLSSETVHRENKEPHLIIYTDLDEVDNHLSIILENASPNPAYNLKVRFDPDVPLDVFEEDNLNKTISENGFYEYPIFPHNYKAIRAYSILTNGTGAFKNPPPNFKDVKATISYELEDGTPRTVTRKLDTSLTKKTYWTKRNTLRAIGDEIQKLTAAVSKLVTPPKSPK